MAAYRSSLEDQDHFCAMLGCYLARAPGDFHCCPGHLQLATQLSDRPFRLYGEFSANSERDAWCASLLVFESNHIPTGVPHLDHNDHLFDKLPWNAGDTFEVPNHHDRCAFLFFKEKPLSYGAIYKDGPEEIKWKGNGNKQVIEHKGADLIIEGVSLRFSGVIPVKIKSIQQGWWMLTHFLYQDHSLYCMSYERKSPRDTEDKDRGSDEEEEADGKDDDDKTNAKEAEKDPWISNPKGARTRITRPRNMSSFGGFGRKFNSNPPNLLASGTDDGISFLSWSRKVQQVSSSTLYDGTTGAIAIERKSSGADDGEISVWGLPKSSEPSHFRLLKGIGSATQDENPWNRKVQQVSSSTSYDVATGVFAMECKSSGADDGEISVWGLPKSSEPSHFRLLKGIGSATQDENPWNRKVQQVSSSTSYDVATGVFAMEWCPSSSSYLPTCAKDKQTIFWYTNTSVGFYGVEENHFRTAPLRAPKWYKHSVGFGGKLGASAKGASTIQSEVSLQSLVTEQSLLKQTSEFEEEESSGSAPDDAIQRALVVGDQKEVVVDQSSANKMADVLVGGRAVPVRNI
ncbi:PREDICTED: protein transport protein SEC31 homolog A-like [Brassica oleracea var. oleracea]|uniref:protein transport protein SEC31 homolog A-like n=1 Tax=Brassica oleracea var. oleracea TaxID=109376 RepID=UPI0006A71C82|nr:PREDICTED: protein transport protein SEC31 homolog A-like [Brassica oleracea var. oleracea]XP_013614374.1 PREDICTED: protein transport protein SEC31 homolog A-like [Brassica oleracea var. oleracea]XP_013614375.1 PREDICTED: protein transport protein SEC31 homolog A-like [Brassica oleracea var. oleracea]